MSKNFLEMYYTFATTGTPSFGRKSLKPITEKLIGNLISSATSVSEMNVNASLGNSEFWNGLQINHQIKE